MKNHNFFSAVPALFALISAGCLLFSCAEKPENVHNDLETMNLKGKVKSLAEMSYLGEIQSGEIKIDEIHSKRTCSFNEDGYFVLDGYFDSAIKRLNKTTYRKDYKGNMVNMIKFNEKGDTLSKTTFSYDQKRRLVKRESKDYYINSWDRINYKYDKYGNEVERNFRSYSGAMSVYYLDDSIKQTKRAIFRPDGYRNSKTISSYDKKHNKTEETYYWNNEKMSSRTIYKSDGKGNIIETKALNPDNKVIWEHIFIYDSDGNLIGEKSGDPEDTFETLRTYKYDKEGNLVEEISLGSGSSKIITGYNKYDDHGNWLSRTTKSVGAKPEHVYSVYVTVREIEYY